MHKNPYMNEHEEVLLISHKKCVRRWKLICRYQCFINQLVGSSCMKKFFILVRCNEFDFILYHYFCRFYSYRSTVDGSMSKHVIEYKMHFASCIELALQNKKLREYLIHQILRFFTQNGVKIYSGRLNSDQISLV